MSDARSEDMISVDLVIPTRIVDSRARENGDLELLAPRFRGFWLGWLQRWLPAGRAYQRVVLDGLGSRVWQAIDGETDVGRIARSLPTPDQDDPAGMVERVWLFVRAMASEGWIELRTPRP